MRGLRPAARRGCLATTLRKFIASQKVLSAYFDRLLPTMFRVDGMKDFVETFAPPCLAPGIKLYDVGGGKHPFLRPERKQALHVTTVGLDIDQRELARAPAGAYDEEVCADITRFRGKEDGDLVLCLAVLEHVKDQGSALASIASLLREGGKALIFVPSRNALYARANMILPEGVKRRLLALLRGEASDSEGFPAYYDLCTPREFMRAAGDAGFDVVELRTYFVSTYFSLFFPAYIVWRLWLVVFFLVAREQAAESFCVALVKRPKA